MGAEDYWKKAQPYLDPGNLLGGGPTRTDIGSVGGARPQDQQLLQDVPGTNFRYDPVSGQYYQKSFVNPATGQTTDLAATQVAAAPNLSQQGAGATAMQQLFLHQQQDAAARAAATRTGQNSLASNYLDVIGGHAPSVAATQLTTGMQHIAADQNAQAAGANGQNAFAARRIAAQNTARAEGDLSGQQALVRAGETTAARTGLASLYGQEAQADTAANNIASNTTLGYGQLGERAEADRTGAQEKADEDYNKSRASVLSGAGSVLGAIL